MAICCDHCGGAAKWTLDVHDNVWYICINDCDGFHQVELFPDELEPWHPEGVVAFTEGDD